MISLHGVRYAVGTRTAKTMMIAAILFTLADLGFLVNISFWLAARGHITEINPLASEGATTLHTMIFGNAALLMIVVFSLLMSADQQTVELPHTITGRWRSAREVWNSPLGHSFQSRPFWIFVTIFALLAISRLLTNSGHTLLSSAFLFVVAGFLIAHIVSIWKLERHMSREASVRVNGYVDECRDFDWKRYGARTDLTAFRQENLDKRWKFHGHMRHPAEAERYQKKAKKHRLLWTVVNTALGIIVIALVNQPVIALFQSQAHNIWHPQQSPEQPGTWEMYRNSLLILLALAPALLQARLGRFETLAKAYENREKELRGKQPIRPHRAKSHYRPHVAGQGRTSTRPERERALAE